MNEDILAELLKFVKYELECLKHKPYTGCSECPLDGTPYCKLGELRIELKEYFEKHREELEEISDLVRRIISAEYHKKILRDILYDEVLNALAEYEEGLANAEDLYKMLIKIKNNWHLLSRYMR